MKLHAVEINASALRHNIGEFRKLIGKERILGVAVKANAYGHGLVETSKVLLESGTDFLCVNAVFEAEKLRKSGVKASILVMGYTPLSELNKLTELNCDTIVYNTETIEALGKIGNKGLDSRFPPPKRGWRGNDRKGRNDRGKINVHLKIETGNHRQGIRIEDLPEVIKLLKKYPNIHPAGISTHFANLEDRANHEYALYQLENFEKAIHVMEENGIAPHYRHCASSAASILLSEAHFNFVRVGIGAYGLWPSEKTKKAAERAGIKINLRPALTWKTIVAQVKEVKKGSLVGYGCSYEMARDGRIAVLPVGYYDGYVRALGNKGAVLIRGHRAPVIGRICMNMFMVDVTDIPEVKIEDEVVLIGKQDKGEITAEEVAEWSGTINYEVTTRIRESIERQVMNKGKVK